MTLPGLAGRARGAIGLRGRIVAVVLITTGATLAIAAVLVLGPLEESLRHADQSALVKAVPRDTATMFGKVHLGTFYSDRRSSDALVAAQNTLQKETGGAFVTVLGSPGLFGRHATPLVQGAGAPDDTFPDAPYSFRTRKARHHLVSIGGSEYASVLIPFRVLETLGGVPEEKPTPLDGSGGHTFARPPKPPPREWFWYVIVVRKPVSAIPVVRVVNRAVLEAAAAGLVLTLLLGIGLSGRLVARLRRLRRTAILVESDEATVPVDRTRDEVGDLARSLATMQARLRDQEEARRAFVATASHELRTPLTSLDGMLELLQDDLRYDDPDVADARELVARARAQSRRLGRLAADLLDLSRMDAQVQLRSEPVELGEMSRAVLAEFELGAEERGIHMELELRAVSIWALGDACPERSRCRSPGHTWSRTPAGCHCRRNRARYVADPARPGPLAGAHPADFVPGGRRLAIRLSVVARSSRRCSGPDSPPVPEPARLGRLRHGVDADGQRAARATPGTGWGRPTSRMC